MSGASSASEADQHSRQGLGLAWLSLIPLTLFGLAFYAFVSLPLPITATVPWIPSLGVDFALRLDGLALQFILLITGVGALVFVYAGGYMAGDPRRVRLFVLLLAFMAAMLGCVSNDNLIVLFVFWELTSLISFLLVGYKHEYESSRKSAQQALMVTGAGGLVLLAGVLLVGHVAETYSVQELIRTSRTWRDHPLIMVALPCLMIGAFTKSAQFPFHFWLPNAMAAPTPVSAYLHSATMVKLGIYLLGRLHPVFGELWLWQFVLVSVGGFTAAWAMVLALKDRDLKRILAWSTVSSLGTLVALIGLPGTGAASATAAFLLAHALYKAPLFFVAGNVDHATGTRSIDQLAGLARATPGTAAAALLAGLSMSGLPLSFGFVAKDVVKEAQVEAYAWVAYSGVFVSAASIAVAGVAAIRIFWHRGGEAIPADVRDVPVLMWLPPLLLGGLGILLGLQPYLVERLITASAYEMRWSLEVTNLSAVPDGPAWVALAIAMALGLAMFVGWDQLHAISRRVYLPSVLTSIGWYERGMRAVPAVAGGITRRLQHGALSGYTSLVIAFVTIVLGVAAMRGGVPVWPTFSWPSLAVIGACLALVLAAIAVCAVRDSFVLLLVSGLVGLGNALLFLFLGAPDLAFTQFTVEVAFVVVIAAILLRVRQMDLDALPRQRAWPRALLAIGAGAAIAFLLLQAGSGSFNPELSEYFSARSVPDANGRNVVNVILVDFRAVDTLGEISVVAVTFLATIPLFNVLQRAKGKRS